MPSLKNLLSPAPNESLPYWFQGNFAASFVLNFCLREFLLSADANLFELRCEPKQLMLLYYKICPCSPDIMFFFAGCYNPLVKTWYNHTSKFNSSCLLCVCDTNSSITCYRNDRSLSKERQICSNCNMSSTSLQNACKTCLDNYKNIGSQMAAQSLLVSAQR